LRRISLLGKTKDLNTEKRCDSIRHSDIGRHDSIFIIKSNFIYIGRTAHPARNILMVARVGANCEAICRTLSFAIESWTGLKCLIYD